MQSAKESNSNFIDSDDRHQQLDQPQRNYGKSRPEDSLSRNPVTESEDEHEPPIASPPPPRRQGNPGKSRPGETLTWSMRHENVVQNNRPKQKREVRKWDWVLDSQDSDYSFEEDEYDRKRKLERKNAAHQTKSNARRSRARSAISTQQRNVSTDKGGYHLSPPAARGGSRQVPRSGNQYEDVDNEFDDYEDPPASLASCKSRRSQGSAGGAIQGQNAERRRRKARRTTGACRGPYAIAEVVAPSIVAAAAEGVYPEAYHDLFPAYHEDGTPRTEAEMVAIISAVDSGTDARRSLRDWHYTFIRSRDAAQGNSFAASDVENASSGDPVAGGDSFGAVREGVESLTGDDADADNANDDDYLDPRPKRRRPVRGRNNLQLRGGGKGLGGKSGTILNLKGRLHHFSGRQKRKRNVDDEDSDINDDEQDSCPKKSQRKPKATGTRKPRNTKNRPAHYTTGEEVADSVIEAARQDVYTGQVSDDLPSHIAGVKQSRQQLAEAYHDLQTGGIIQRRVRLWHLSWQDANARGGSDAA